MEALPDDVLEIVLCKSAVPTIASCSQVCRVWNTVCETRLWTAIMSLHWPGNIASSWEKHLAANRFAMRVAALRSFAIQLSARLNVAREICFVYYSLHLLSAPTLADVHGFAQQCASALQGLAPELFPCEIVSHYVPKKHSEFAAEHPPVLFRWVYAEYTKDFGHAPCNIVHCKLLLCEPQRKCEFRVRVKPEDDRKAIRMCFSFVLGDDNESIVEFATRLLIPMQTLRQQWRSAVWTQLRPLAPELGHGNTGPLIWETCSKRVIAYFQWVSQIWLCCDRWGLVIDDLNNVWTERAKSLLDHLSQSTKGDICDWLQSVTLVDSTSNVIQRKRRQKSLFWIAIQTCVRRLANALLLMDVRACFSAFLSEAPELPSYYDHDKPMPEFHSVFYLHWAQKAGPARNRQDERWPGWVNASPAFRQFLSSGDPDIAVVPEMFSQHVSGAIIWPPRLWHRLFLLTMVLWPEVLHAAIRRHASSTHETSASSCWYAPNEFERIVSTEERQLVHRALARYQGDSNDTESLTLSA
eukprot:TRINITY_DN7896_c0_g1_i1.p1 TRINITY_DN7896_c0_g1~~TRINITY_DN7896_c0_g1_i1.p1  ORF type:complete len:534 (-),score=62.20 TRINITY_DN7896_c0_g1_i1:30-1604(-)